MASIGWILAGVVAAGAAAASLGASRFRRRRRTPGRLVEPDLATPPRDPRPLRRTARAARPGGRKRPWKRSVVNPRANGHSKENGHNTLR